MDKKQIISKTKRKIFTIMLIYLCIAGVCIGIVFVPKFFNDSKQEEAVDLHTLLLDNKEPEGQYVKIEIDTVPVEIMPFNTADYPIYAVTDVNDKIYIAELSDETNKKIWDHYNSETGKFDSVYELKGILQPLDDTTQRIIINNSYRVIQGVELTADNYSKYLDSFYIKDNAVSDRSVTLYKCVGLVGVFFIVLALGYGLPNLIKISKGNFGIYDEERMRKTLEKYIPAGENLEMGILAIGQRICITTVFGHCEYKDEMLVPCAQDSLLSVHKNKFSKYEIYVGITENHLIISECEPCKYFYEFNPITNAEGLDVEEVGMRIHPEDIGHCIALDDIKKRLILPAFAGSTKCSFILKNGSIIDFLIQKDTYIHMPSHKNSHEMMNKRFYSI